MDEFRQVGEILGSLKAFMVLKHDISINQRQCSLLVDMLELAFETISEEIRKNLRLEERNTRWRALELPMKELHRIFKEADLYVRQCLDIKDWWGKAINLHMNRDCVEFHIHNLLCCFPVVIEAVEAAAEISGVDPDDMQRRRIAIMKKYDQDSADSKVFQWRFGKQYLVPREIISRLDTAWKEDRWLLLEKVEDKKKTAVVNSAKPEQRLGELLLRKLDIYMDESKEKIMPSPVLVGAHDYHVKRRLGSGPGHFKEIHWLGENFALRTFFGDIEPLNHEITLVLSLSHPNVLQYNCAFYDEERKEGFLVIELMSKDLGTYIKEHSGHRNRLPFSTPVAVDIMLQIARGMEYLHSKQIYHGDLNPSNILLKARNSSAEGLFLAKVTGFGLNSIKRYGPRNPKPTGIDPDIWQAPEVLAELEQPSSKCTRKYTEKADVYSFGMLCFEILTGKIPFKDGHLQGEKMVRNIRAGERPLFSYPFPKYLANLTRKCWQANPNLRPTFSSICRILRYIKKILVIYPDHGHPDFPPPLVDYCDIEGGYLKKFPGEGNGGLAPVSEIPFQMFAYRLIEKEKVSGKNWDSTIGDEHLAAMDDLFFAPSDRRSVCSEIIDRNATIDVDMRSVISEIPHRKLFALDQRSFGSVSPGKRFSAIAADQRSVGGETPERKCSLVMRTGQVSPKIQTLQNKIDQKLTSQKVNMNFPNKATASRVVEFQSYSSMPSENNASLIKGIEKKLENNEMLENNGLQKTTDCKPTFSESSDEKIITPVTGYHRSAEVLEKKSVKIIEQAEKIVSVSCKTSPKKFESTGKNIPKPRNSKNSDKKPALSRKLKDNKTKSTPETPNKNFLRSSPARIKKEKPSFSSCSSPARANKACPSPKRLIASASKEYSSPVESPLHPCAHKACPSPKRLIAYASKENSSPAASPLHPCTRCSRLSRQASLPLTLSPQRPK